MNNTQKLADALRVMVTLVDGVAFVGQPGDTERPLRKARAALHALETFPEPTMQECAAALLAAMEREMPHATPNDAEWLRRNAGIVRKMAQ